MPNMTQLALRWVEQQTRYAIEAGQSPGFFVPVAPFTAVAPAVIAICGSMRFREKVFRWSC